MDNAIAAVIRNHQLERLDRDLFRGETLYRQMGRVYGGQVMAQAINAANRTVDDAFALHSFHCYFLRPGDPTIPILYFVRRIRDGRSFATRTVEAVQNGEDIFHVSLSFQRFEEGFEHQATMPDVPGPEELASDADRMREAFVHIGVTDYNWPIEFRQVAPVDVAQPQRAEPVNYVWFRADGAVGDDRGYHEELLAYASDNPILLTALRPHGANNFSEGIMMATLDHAMWYHRPFRVDDWLLFELHSTNAAGGRGLTHGSMFDREGRLVASAMQEGLIRRRAPR